MKFTLLLIFSFLIINVTYCQRVNADEMPVYYSVRVSLTPSFTIKDAEEYGIELEHALIKDNFWIETVVSDISLNRLRSDGVSVTILIEDLSTFYKARNSHSFSKQIATVQNSPQNFSLGSNGGYFTLDEIYSNFEKMRTFAPATVTEAFSIGSSFEKRPLYVYRFGNTESDSKPQILFTSLHHAREPGSASTLIYFLWKLLEDAASGNAEATYLLDNRVIYVIPVLNPDGYLYNERNGFGSLWRKNRRNNNDGTFGVDLNRNYGPIQYWNSPEGGSSDKAFEDTYRGTAPFSEPETQAIRNFVLEQNFNICVNYHTFSNVLIYPFGYSNKETSDSNFFRAFSADALKINKYSAGRDVQTVGYTTRGVSDDWMYSLEGTKPRTYSFTAEVGTRLDGFYAPFERIIPQCEENLYFNLQALWSADVNYRITDATTIITNEILRPKLSITIQNTGLTTPDSAITLVLNSLDPRLRITKSVFILNALESAQSTTKSIDAEIIGQYPNGDVSLVEAIITQNGVARRDTLTFQFNKPITLSLFDNTLTDTLWSMGTWGIVPNPDGGFMLTDSPNGNYEDSTSNFIQLKTPIDVIQSNNVTLEFWTKWTLESNFDYGVVQVSVNDGRTWEYLQTSRMKNASGVKGSMQEENSVGFDGNFPTWVRQECTLDQYRGKKILLRFGVLADPKSNFDGMYVRDISIKTYDDTMGTTPAELLQDITLEVFPTPTEQGKFIYAVLTKPLVQFPEKYYHLSLYNTLGERCFERTGMTNSGNEIVFSIPTITVASGVYHLIIEYDGKLYTSPCQIHK
ncbi:MAG: immune inhibitor A [Ignavibacteria bacterium]|nr:immune inhibitor A [Ignavibacteria bacterium]